MTYTITNRCINCDTCRPECPTGAIQVQEDRYWIEAALCNHCQGYYPEPQCVVNCPVNSPVPLQAKKGRYKIDVRPETSPDLFPHGQSHPLASAMVSWELCNLLAQRDSLPWETAPDGSLCYPRPVNGGQGEIVFYMTETPSTQESLAEEATLASLRSVDLRAACLHLIFAAHATALERPWEQPFVIGDRQIESYLGLEKRKDLSKSEKLTLIKNLAQQPCRVQVSIDWPQQGRVAGFLVERCRLWHLVEIEHHFQEDSEGCRHLVGLTFKIKAGIWAKHFLNKQGCRDRTAFYQYGNLPKFLIGAVMSVWQQHEGAARMMLWLLFKTKMGKEQRITVPTLMRVAYGEHKVRQASLHREDRKRLLRTFESDLEVLNHYSLKPVFDPVTYPPEIQPLWAKLADLPDDGEEALNFWIEDANQDRRLTDAGPRGKWKQLLKARILRFDLPPEWEEQLARLEKKKRRGTTKTGTKAIAQPSLCGKQIKTLRASRQLSQRELAQMTGKSQSWIRDIENGRFRIKDEDQLILRKALGLA